MALRISWREGYPAATLVVLGVFFEAFVMLRVTGGVTVGDTLILAAGALVFARALRGRTRIWLPPWLLVGLPLLAASTVIDVLLTGRHGRTDIIVAVELAFCAIVLPSIIASQPADGTIARRLIVAWVTGNIVGAALAYLQFRGFDLRPLDRWLVWNSGRVAGMTPNPNTLGASLALVAPMCLALAADARALRPMAFWTLSLLACIYVIDLTGSRTSIAAAAAGCLIAAVLVVVHTRRTEAPLRLLQIACGLALVVAAWQLRSGYHDSAIERLLGHATSAGISNFFRDALLRFSLQAIGAAPFLGHGYASMGHAAHNLPMALIQGGGLIAFAGFMLAQGGLLILTVRLYLQSHNRPGYRGVAIGMLGVWCTWIALGIYDVSLLNRNAYIAFGIAVLWWLNRHAADPVAAPDAPRMRQQPA